MNIAFAFLIFAVLAAALMRLAAWAQRRRLAQRERAILRAIERQKQAQVNAFLDYAWLKAERELQQERAEQQRAVEPSADFYPVF